MPIYNPPTSDDSHNHSTLTLDTERLTLSAGERSTLAGTVRQSLLETTLLGMTAQPLGTITILNSLGLIMIDRASLAGGARASMIGDSRLTIYGLNPPGRLTLAGRGM